ncbi:Oidioi.mRNA.OKI2018_I69.chr1.g366.t1.cds [Oikopleura dioica]|uniref:Oidioi.mRNA.OKI2018_I69.chr1.g366.t1.cds n=1 Tax=Oikopleura dioica TaxID=34765 RepID=A0ABN7SNG5_OIKDI|nr:Oidioi.mRNA.OKI2018_I69.chr1.g366.t1.cds [Oikopleura dioica]
MDPNFENDMYCILQFTRETVLDAIGVDEPNEGMSSKLPGVWKDYLETWKRLGPEKVTFVIWDKIWLPNLRNMSKAPNELGSYCKDRRLPKEAKRVLQINNSLENNGALSDEQLEQLFAKDEKNPVQLSKKKSKKPPSAIRKTKKPVKL